MRMGQVIGATDAKADHPVDRPLAPVDLWATVYRFLGIDIEHCFHDTIGRPMAILPSGRTGTEAESSGFRQTTILTVSPGPMIQL